MSNQNYITIQDITDGNIKQVINIITARNGDLDEIQSYVDRANDYFEDLCLQLQIDVENIKFPIPSIAREHILHWLNWNYAKEHNGLVNSDSGFGDTTYAYMEETNYKYYTDSLKHMNITLLDSTNTDNRISTSFGKMVR